MTRPTQDPQAAPPRAGHLPGIDGIRALAVAGVLLYHGDVPWLFPGGFLGVDVFFTVSGFLITLLLVREYRASGTIAIGAFYVRRARRLFPAAFALLAASVLAAWLLAPDALGRLQADIPAALTYTSNWWQVFSAQSYFEQIGRPALLQHLWSLAIEEQFYLAWPAVALLVLRRSGERRLTALALGLSVAGTAWMAWLAVRHGYPADADPSRAYLGTDTHAMGLLLGAALGAAWTPWRDAATAGDGEADDRARRVLDAIGAASLAGLVLFMAGVRETHDFLFRGGFLVVALLSVLLIVSAADPRSRTGRLLSRQPLRWLGERSYGLYLWHWPVYVLLRPGFELPADPWLALALRLGLTAAIAELSYRWIEVPVRSGSVARWRRPWRLTLGAAAGGAAAVVAALLVRPAIPIEVPGDVLAALGTPSGDGGPASEAGVSDGPGPLRPKPAPVASAPRPPLPEPGPDGQRLTAIGDSVLLGARDHLTRAIDGAAVDAEVGRQGRQGLARVQELKSQGALAPFVLVHLGTNGYLTESHMRSLLATLADSRKVLLVNVNAPRRWSAHNNELLERLRGEFPNVSLIDWHAMSRERPDYFVSDGVHLTGAGIRALTDAIRETTGLPERARRAPPARLHLARAEAPAPARAPVRDRDAPTAAEPAPERIPDPTPAHVPEEGLAAAIPARGPEAPGPVDEAAEGPAGAPREPPRSAPANLPATDAASPEGRPPAARPGPDGARGCVPDPAPGLLLDDTPGASEAARGRRSPAPGCEPRPWPALIHSSSAAGIAGGAGTVAQ